MVCFSAKAIFIKASVTAKFALTNPLLDMWWKEPPDCHLTRWRHQIETFFALLAICAGNSPVPGEFPAQRPVTRSFDVFLICVWINDWINNREAGDLRRYRTHYDVIQMIYMEVALYNRRSPRFIYLILLINWCIIYLIMSYLFVACHSPGDNQCLDYRVVVAVDLSIAYSGCC